jgi:hypothetical protein
VNASTSTSTKKSLTSWRSWPETAKVALRDRLREEAYQKGLIKAQVSHPFVFADLKIRTKDKRIITFAPNAVQRGYLGEILPDWQSDDLKMQGLREIILKFRQPGISTLVLALLFLDTINHPNTYTVVLAQDAESTQLIFEMVQRFYKNLPEARRPRTQYANRREYLWPDLGSRIFVGTAGADDFGRGLTINNVHGSEVAKWKDGDKIASSLLQAVPPDGNIFLESTANGIGNFFQVEYDNAKNHVTDYTARFFAWFEFPEEYAKPVRDDFIPTGEEQKLVDTYGVTDEQLQWRRDKMREPGMSKDFRQEYPANDDEAFKTSGVNYFNSEKLSEWSTVLKRPEHQPLLGVRIPDQFPRLQNAYADGLLKIWQLPQADKIYCVGADAAEGINDYGDHDFNCADVGDNDTWEQCAHLHDQGEPHEFGLLLDELGRWYKMALLGVMRLNHGHTVLSALLHTTHYPEAKADQAHGVYFHQEYDEQKKMRARRPGWPETGKSKVLMLDDLNDALNQDDLGLHCAESVSELRRYVKKPGGKSGGEGRSHDDRVTSLAALVQMLKLPKTRAESKPLSSMTFSNFG